VVPIVPAGLGLMAPAAAAAAPLPTDEGALAGWVLVVAVVFGASAAAPAPAVVLSAMVCCCVCTDWRRWRATPKLGSAAPAARKFCAAASYWPRASSRTPRLYARSAMAFVDGR